MYVQEFPLLLVLREREREKVSKRETINYTIQLRNDKFAELAQMVACLLLVQHVRG